MATLAIALIAIFAPTILIAQCLGFLGELSRAGF